MATMTIELPPHLQLELEALAQRTGQSEAEIIVEAIVRYLQARP